MSLFIRMLRLMPALLPAMLLFLVPAYAAAGGGTITVAAASSLTFPLKEIAGAFERESGARVLLSFGSTGNLAAQIENGAPFDLFLAADTRHVRELAEAGHLDPETEVVYAEGRVVLAVNRKSGVRAAALEDLLDPGIRRVSMANPDHAPYGLAAREALIALGLWERVRPKVVYAESVRQALVFIQTGDAQAGIVALSVAGVPEIEYSPVDPSLHGPISQSAAVVARSRDRELAASFLDYLLGPAGRAALGRYGFAAPGRSGKD